MTYAFPIYASLKHITGTISYLLIQDKNPCGSRAEGVGTWSLLMIDKSYN